MTAMNWDPIRPTLTFLGMDQLRGCLACRADTPVRHAVQPHDLPPAMRRAFSPGRAGVSAPRGFLLRTEESVLTATTPPDTSAGSAARPRGNLSPACSPRPTR